MPKTPSKIHMHDMVKIDTTVFEILRGGGGAFKAPLPRIVSCLKYSGSDRVKTCLIKSVCTNIFNAINIA